MIVLDYTDRRPIYEQVIERIQELIYKGILESDEKLPSVRSLAMELSINPNTIQRAYSELEKGGFLYSIKGKGNFVAADHRLFEKRKVELMEKLEPVLWEARDAGITQTEIQELVKKVYDFSSEVADTFDQEDISVRDHALFQRHKTDTSGIEVSQKYQENPVKSEGGEE